MSKALDNISALLIHLKEEHNKIDNYHSGCSRDDAPVMA